MKESYFSPVKKVKEKRAIDQIRRLKKQKNGPEAVELLLKYTKEYKTKCEFNGVDFEPDLATMYTAAADVNFPRICL